MRRELSTPDAQPHRNEITAVDRFDFKFLVTSGSHTGSVRVVAGATDESDPCGTYQLDLSGKLTGFPGTSGSRTGATSKEFDTTTGV